MAQGPDVVIGGLRRELKPNKTLIINVSGGVGNNIPPKLEKAIRAQEKSFKVNADDLLGEIVDILGHRKPNHFAAAPVATSQDLYRELHGSRNRMVWGRELFSKLLDYGIFRGKLGAIKNGPPYAWHLAERAPEINPFHAPSLVLQLLSKNKFVSEHYWENHEGFSKSAFDSLLKAELISKRKYNGVMRYKITDKGTSHLASLKKEKRVTRKNIRI